MGKLVRKTCLVSLALLGGVALLGALALGAKPGATRPPVGPSSGVLYFWDQGLDPTPGGLGWPCRINADGTDYQVLASGVANSTFVVEWNVSYGNSPRFFVYLGQDAEGSGLFADTEEGGVERRLVFDDPLLTSGAKPAISQDDERLAFTRAGKLYVADIVYDESGVPVQLVHCVPVADVGYRNNCLAWSPDGTEIAFDQQGVGSLAKNDIFVVSLTFDADWNVIAGSTRNITQSPRLYEMFPAWSPVLSDGTSRIAYRVPRIQGDGDDIYTLLPNGQGLSLAVSNANSGAKYNVLPAWSPDGAQIAFGALGSNTSTQALMRSASDGSTTAARILGFSKQLQIRRLHWR